MATASNDVQNNMALAKGLRTEAIKAFEKKAPKKFQEMSRLMNFVTAQGLIDTFYVPESTPVPSIWKKGQSVRSGTWGEQSFKIPLLRWGLKIQWDRMHRELQQVGNLKQTALDAGNGFADLTERTYYQILKGATDPDLLPELPLSADGKPIFDTTDFFGNPRYGVTSGNLLTGTDTGGGPPTIAGVRKDVWRAKAQARRFKHTEGITTIFNEAQLKQMIVMFSAEYEEIFSEALIPKLIVQRLDGSAGGAGASGGGNSNVHLEVGHNITLISSEYLTGPDFFVSFPNVPLKPVYRSSLGKFTFENFDARNSDFARENDKEGIVMRMLGGYGVGFAGGIVKIDNS